MNAITPPSRITYHRDLIQGDDEWLAARLGLLTASEMKLIVTPTLKAAANEKERAHVYELAAQRITGFVEPSYIGDDMLRGQEDEIDARMLYERHFAPVDEVGFITNSRWGFTIGYSPDGLVGDDGLIECKSRRQKFQVEWIVKHEPPPDYVIQLQTGLLVTERKWIDFLSYSGGLPMMRIRVYPDPVIQAAIINAATAFEANVVATIAKYHERISDGQKWIRTERRIEQEMFT